VFARGLIIIVLVLIILGVPYALRPPQPELGADALTLTALSPHNEAIRFEFQHSFSKWHQERYGRPVRIDWRTIGGTSAISRYISSEYVSAFRAHWTGELGKPWTREIEAGFANQRLDPNRPKKDTPPEVVEARRAFLESNVGIGVDVFFGGGTYDHGKQAQIGNTISAGIANDHPEVLRPEIIPKGASGEIFYDRQGRFYGCCLTCFGICYNRDVLRRLKMDRAPSQWRDLANPGFLAEIGLADPTKSGSATKAFEMLIQQQIAQEIARQCKQRKVEKLANSDESTAVADGFWQGMRLIQCIAANSRYFTNTSSKVPIDVVQGNAAAGMCIDFYGRFEAGMAAAREGTDRMDYVTPLGGSGVSADPISMLRGAPHPELAKRFVHFCLTQNGQRLWYYRVGTPGGPVKYALRRLPIRRDMYTPAHREYASDPDVDPYKLAGAFTYNGRWTAPLFDFIRQFIRAMCIDTHHELTAAWSAIIAAGGPSACPEAFDKMQDMPLTYDQAGKLNLRNKLESVRLLREWDAHFRRNYTAARQLALKTQPRTAQGGAGQ
jgi:iron(III) transport system substrate-binding protein